MNVLESDDIGVRSESDDIGVTISDRATVIDRCSRTTLPALRPVTPVDDCSRI